MKKRYNNKTEYHSFQERKKAHIKSEYGESGYQNLEELKKSEYTKELGDKLYRESEMRFFQKELAITVLTKYFLNNLTKK